MMRRHRFVTLAVALAGLPAVLTLASCSQARDTASSAPGNAAAPAVAGADGAATKESATAQAGEFARAGAPAGPDGGVAMADSARAGAGSARVGNVAGAKSGTSNPASLTAPAQPQLIRTADVVVRVDQLGTASARARAVAQSVGGTVSSEVTTYPDAPAETVVTSGTAATTTPDAASEALPRTARPGESVLVLRVPVASLDQAVDRVTAIGTVLSRTSSSQDVTADLADLGSRVKTQRASVDRVRALLAKAGSLQDVVLLESELSRRESDLEALEARQTALADRAAMSTLTVTLRTPDVTTSDGDGSNGFVDGLKRAGQAVITSTAAILTLLGGLLPVLVLAALVGMPLWWLLRRRRARRADAAPSPTAPSPASPVPPASPTPPPGS